MCGRFQDSPVYGGVLEIIGGGSRMAILDRSSHPDRSPGPFGAAGYAVGTPTRST